MRDVPSADHQSALDYLKRRYPEQHAQTLDLVRKVAAAVGPEASLYAELAATGEANALARAGQRGADG